MPRSPSLQPTDVELELLKVLWDLGPAELGPICEALRRQRPVATTTVATMLTVMLNKGLVRRSPGKRGYVWSAALGREAAQTRLLKRLIDRVFDGSAQLLVTHLIEGELSDDEREQIRDLLAEPPAKGGRSPRRRKDQGPPKSRD